LRRPEPGTEPRLRVNHQIRISPLRVIGPDGEQIGVISRDEALDRARQAGFDLVEISPTAMPPVCKIMDYGKYKYELKKKTQRARQKQHVIEVKEVRLRPRTDDHDIDTKTRQARGFLEEGNKVVFAVQFRGREASHPEIALQMLQGILANIQEICKLERAPMIDGRRMLMVVTPR
jgi:translation initiation factor IF-3